MLILDLCISQLVQLLLPPLRFKGLLLVVDLREQALTPLFARLPLQNKLFRENTRVLRVQEIYKRLLHFESSLTLLLSLVSFARAGSCSLVIVVVKQEEGWALSLQSALELAFHVHQQLNFLSVALRCCVLQLWNEHLHSCALLTFSVGLLTFWTYLVDWVLIEP